MFRKCLSCFPIGFLPFTQEFATFCNQILFNDPACKPSPKPARKGAGLGGTYGAMGEHHKKNGGQKTDHWSVGFPQPSPTNI